MNPEQQNQSLTDEPNPQPVTEAPVTPIQPTPEQPRKSNKKLFIILGSVIGGLILIAVIASILFFTLFAVSKQDYQAAQTQMRAVSQAANDGSFRISGLTDDNIDELQQALNTFKTENAKLEDQKALQRDVQLRDDYDAYEKKASAYISYLETLIPSLQKVASVSSDASAITSRGNVTVDDVQEILTKLEGIQDVKDPTAKAFVDKSVTNYQTILTNLRIVQDSSQSTSARQLAATRANSAALAVQTAARTFGTDIQKEVREKSPATEFNNLNRAVNDKANGAR